MALMSALGHNPAAARWAFTEGGTTTMKLGGRDVAVNSFIHDVLLDLTGKDLEEGASSAELLRRATQIEPAVFKFHSLEDFQLAANAPHPNVVYEFQGIRYTTDELGRPIKVSGSPLTVRAAANRALRRAIGKGPDALDGDVGFHLFAESFGGPTNKLKTVDGNRRVSADLNLTVEPKNLTDSYRGG